MAKCPSCGKEVPEPAKTWSYGPKTRKGQNFTVELYKCECGKSFRKYLKQAEA